MYFILSENISFWRQTSSLFGLSGINFVSLKKTFNFMGFICVHFDLKSILNAAITISCNKENAFTRFLVIRNA